MSVGPRATPLAAILGVLCCSGFCCCSVDALLQQPRGSLVARGAYEAARRPGANWSSPQLQTWRSRAHAALDASGEAQIVTDLSSGGLLTEHEKVDPSSAVEAQEAENLAKDAQKKFELAAELLALGRRVSPGQAQSAANVGSEESQALRENVQLRLQATKLSAELEKLRDEDAQLRQEDSQLRVQDSRLRRALLGGPASRDLTGSTPALELLDEAWHWNATIPVVTDASLSMAFRRPHRHLKEFLIIGGVALTALLVCLWSSRDLIEEDSDSDDEEAEVRLKSMLGKQKSRGRWCCGCCGLCMNLQVALFCGGVTIMTVLLGAVMWQMGMLQPILAQFTVYSYVIILVVLFVMLMIHEMWRTFHALITYVLVESRKMKAVFSGSYNKVGGVVKDFLDDGRLTRTTVPALARRMGDRGRVGTKAPARGLGSFEGPESAPSSVVSAPAGDALRDTQGAFPKRAGPRLV